MPNGHFGSKVSDSPEITSPRSFRITLKASREFVKRGLCFELICKFLKEAVKRSKDLSSTVFLHQLLKNDGCANLLLETKTSHVFESIVYFRHYVIGIHKFARECCFSFNERAMCPSASHLHVGHVTRAESHFPFPVEFFRVLRVGRIFLVQIHFVASTIYDKSELLGGWIVEGSSFLISLQMKSSISASER
jgi:hypothetical protein